MRQIIIAGCLIGLCLTSFYIGTAVGTHWVKTGTFVRVGSPRYTNSSFFGQCAIIYETSGKQYEACAVDDPTFAHSLNGAG